MSDPKFPGSRKRKGKPVRVFTRRKVLLPLLAAVAALLIVAAVALANTTLTSHTGEVGATWTQHSSSTGTSEVITATGWLRPSAASTTSVYYASGTPTNANYTVEADLKWLGTINGSGHGPGIIGRVNTGATTFYMCRYSEGISFDGWQLYKFVSGTATQIGSNSSQGLTAGTTYHMKLTMNGTAIDCSVDGVSKASGTDSSITAAGKAGFRLFGGSGTTDDTNGVELDNFTATDL